MNEIRVMFLVINLTLLSTTLYLWSKPRWNHYYIFHKGETILFDVRDGYRWPWQRNKLKPLMRFGETEVEIVSLGFSEGAIDKVYVYDRKLTQEEINKLSDKQ